MLYDSICIHWFILLTLYLALCLVKAQHHPPTQKARKDVEATSAAQCQEIVSKDAKMVETTRRAVIQSGRIEHLERCLKTAEEGITNGVTVLRAAWLAVGGADVAVHSAKHDGDKNSMTQPKESTELSPIKAGEKVWLRQGSLGFGVELHIRSACQVWRGLEVDVCIFWRQISWRSDIEPQSVKQQLKHSVFELVASNQLKYFRKNT